MVEYRPLEGGDKGGSNPRLATTVDDAFLDGFAERSVGIPQTALQDLIDGGFVFGEQILEENYTEEENGKTVVAVSPEDFLYIAMYFFGAGLDDFEWQIDQPEILLGGYNAIVNSAGYGCFDF